MSQLWNATPKARVLWYCGDRDCGWIDNANCLGPPCHNYVSGNVSRLILRTILSRLLASAKNKRQHGPKPSKTTNKAQMGLENRDVQSRDLISAHCIAKLKCSDL